MKTIIVRGWDVGFHKVRFTQMLMSEFGYALSEAKHACEGVLENRPLHLSVRDEEAGRISSKLALLGTKTEVERSIDS